MNSPETLKMLVGEGDGVGICSRVSIEAELALGRLCYAPLPGVLPESGGFVLAWRKDHILTPLQQSFADILNNN